jgi:hypothetical protein
VLKLSVLRKKNCIGFVLQLLGLCIVVDADSSDEEVSDVRGVSEAREASYSSASSAPQVHFYLKFSDVKKGQ